MLFSKDILKELLWCSVGEAEEFDGIEYKLIETKLVNTSRWHLHYEMVFLVSEKYYVVRYRKGATESQDEYPFEYADDMIECQEVKPTEKTIIVYVPVEEPDDRKSKPKPL